MLLCLLMLPPRLDIEYSLRTLVPLCDQCHSKWLNTDCMQMEDTLNTLSQTVEQIQESQNHLNTEKKWSLGVIQEEIEQQERDWKVELTQLNQVSSILSKKLDRMGLEKDI
jgi:uncharacterized protein YoxC